MPPDRLPPRAGKRRAVVPAGVATLLLVALVAGCVTVASDPARSAAFERARACAGKAAYIGVRADVSGNPEFYFAADRYASGAQLAQAQSCYREATARATASSAPSPPRTEPSPATAATARPDALPQPATPPTVPVAAAPADQSPAAPVGRAATSPAGSAPVVTPRPASPPDLPLDGPIIALASPADGVEVATDRVTLVGAAASPSGITHIEVFVNGGIVARPAGLAQSRGAASGVDFSERVPLAEGRNAITVTAFDARNRTATRTVTVTRVVDRGKIWAVAIGISRYRAVRPLAYADRDAAAFQDYLVRQLGVPAENVTLLTNEQATLMSLKRTLGTDLRRRAGERDTVIIFYAGHGAPEAEAGRADDDGLEKYLVPYDADPGDLYTTGLPMREIETIFQRLASDRVIFITDSCYSGATAGRTFATASRRAVISDGFLERLARARGRIVLTASRASEISEERDELGHGVFTYYLLEGLRGAADSDGDGIVTVDEVYAYVARKVPEVTGQNQHPQKKGEVEGTLVLGRVNRAGP
jgi:hypothetical protein